jgi:hypothetical protein
MKRRGDCYAATYTRIMMGVGTWQYAKLSSRSFAEFVYSGPKDHPRMIQRSLNSMSQGVTIQVSSWKVEATFESAWYRTGMALESCHHMLATSTDSVDQRCHLAVGHGIAIVTSFMRGHEMEAIFGLRFSINDDSSFSRSIFDPNRCKYDGHT